MRPRRVGPARGCARADTGGIVSEGTTVVVEVFGAVVVDVGSGTVVVVVVVDVVEVVGVGVGEGGQAVTMGAWSAGTVPTVAPF